MQTFGSENPSNGSKLEETLILNLEVLFILSLFFVTFILAHIIRKFGSPVPESGTTVLVGIGYGFLLRYGKEWFTGFVFDDWVTNFSPNFFFMLLLPIIIFESGFTIHKNRLFKNAGSIFAFAIVGTLFCSLVTGFCLWGIVEKGLDFKELNLTEYLQFGALISSTDPVATLAVFGQLGANKLLESLCFGESVLNDAIAITLVKTLEQFQGKETVTALEVLGGIGWFIVTSVGSTFVGIICAVLLSVLLKYTLIRRHPPIEFIFLIMFAYLSYMTSDAASLSGVVAIFVYGLTSRHYTWYCLSKAGRTSSLTSLVALKELSEQAVFCFLGIAIPTLFEYYNWPLIGMAILVTFIVRAIMVASISFILNLRRTQNRITGKMQFVLWLAGLRGAVSYALALHIHPKNQFMITTTHSVILFTIFVLGGTTGPVLRAFKLVEKEEPAEAVEDSGRIHVDKWWHKVDRNYIIPYISYPRNVHTKKELRVPLNETANGEGVSAHPRSALSLQLSSDDEEGRSDFPSTTTGDELFSNISESLLDSTSEGNERPGFEDL